MWIFRLVGCALSVVLSIIVAFFICLFFPISFWWMLVVIPVDILVISLLIKRWTKEQAEKDRRVMEQW